MKKQNIAMIIVVAILLVITISHYQNKNLPTNINLQTGQIVSRTATSNTYYLGNGTYRAESYPNPVNMKDSSGNYVPYSQVTSLTYSNGAIILSWNGKEVIFHLYVRNKDGTKEPITPQLEQSLGLKTGISSSTGSYYFNHTLEDSTISAVGYDLETKGVTCNFKDNLLICDEQEIDFNQLVNQQGLNISTKLNQNGLFSIGSSGDNSIEITGNDLSYIDPTISLGPWYQSFMTKNYYYNTYQVSSSTQVWLGHEYIDTADNNLYRGWVRYDTSGVPNGAIISQLTLSIPRGIWTNSGCLSGIINIMAYKDTNYYPASNSVTWWNYINDETNYVTSSYDFSYTPFIIDLGSQGIADFNSQVSLTHSPFSVGLTTNAESSSHVKCYVEPGSGIQLNYVYTIPDTTPPTTTPSGNGYSFGTWAKSNVSVSLSCSDIGGGSCASTYYCIDSLNSCTPGSTYSSAVTISSEGKSYIRYFSKDTYNNQESTQSQQIKIDLTAPITNITIA